MEPLVDQISPQDQKPSFDEYFTVSVENDLELVRGALARIKQDQRFGVMVDEWDLKRYKETGNLKYSDSDLQGTEWDDADIALALAEVKKKKIDKYFYRIIGLYEGISPISDSKVRLDQEQAIAADLDDGKPVLIRGNWRLGKTSMLQSLVNHRYGQDNSLYIDTSTESLGDKSDTIEFTRRFGLYAVAEFFNDGERNGLTGTEKYEHEEAIRNEILASGLSPLEYLNNYLRTNDRKVFLGLDEVIGLQKHPGRLEHVAQLKDLSNIQLAVVLHRYEPYEEEFRQVFSEFTSHFIRSLRREEVAEIVRNPLKDSEITFSDDAIDEIIAFTGSRPMEIQNVCRSLLNPNAKHPNLKFNYTAEDIRMLEMRDIWELEEAGFSSEIGNYKRVYRNSMSDEERELVKKLCEAEAIDCDQIDLTVAKPLLDTTYVVQDTASNTYRINGSLFKKVVQEIIEFDEEDDY